MMVLADMAVVTTVVVILMVMTRWEVVQIMALLTHR
jgi:hypothetical protein